LRVTRVLIAEQVGQTHQPGAPRPGVRRPGVAEVTGVRLSPVQHLLGGAGHVGDDIGVVLQQRTGRVVGGHHAEPLGQLLHRCGRFDVVPLVRDAVTELVHDRDPQVLVDPGGQAVVAGHHQVDGDAAGVHLRLDRAHQVGCATGLPGDRGDDVRVLIDELVDYPLGQLCVALDVQDVQRYRLVRGVRVLLRCG